MWVIWCQFFSFFFFQWQINFHGFYSMPKPSLWKNKVLFNTQLGNKGVQTFPKSFCLKVRMIEWLVYKFTYDVAVQHISHNTMETLPKVIQKVSLPLFSNMRNLYLLNHMDIERKKRNYYKIWQTFFLSPPTLPHADDYSFSGAECNEGYNLNIQQ